MRTSRKISIGFFSLTFFCTMSAKCDQLNLACGCGDKGNKVNECIPVESYSNLESFACEGCGDKDNKYQLSQCESCKKKKKKNTLAT